MKGAELNDRITKTGPAKALEGLFLEDEIEGGSVERMEVIGLRMVTQSTLRRVGACLITLAAMFTAALLLQEPAHAGQSYTWTGEGNGTSWTDPCNWYEKDACQQKYPGSEATDDTATIEGLEGGPSAVTLGEDLTVASLNLGRGPTGASVTGGGLTLSQGLNWSGGNLTTEVTMSAGSGGAIGGSDYKKLDGAIHNHGNLSLDSGILHLANAAQINNSGTFSVAKGSQVQGLVCCLTPAEINNSATGRVEVGSFLPLPGADTATIDAVSFNAAGTIDVGGGVLELRWAPGEIAAGTRFVGDGKFRVTNKAEMFMSGTFEVLPATEFELDSCSGTCNQGVLTGTGTMDNDGFFLWKGGDVDGQLTLGAGVHTRISGPASKDLDGRIVNLGRTVFSDDDPTGLSTGPLRFGQSAKFTNKFLFTADDGLEMVGIAGCCSPPAATFDNAGTFTAVGPGVTTIRSMGFRAGGEVNVAEGALDLRSGAATLPAGSKITGTGSVTLTEGQTMTMAGAFGVGPEAELEIGSCTADGCTTGRLQGTGTLGGGGRLEWVSGYMGTGNTGATDDLTIAQGSKMALTGRASKQLLGSITNRGTATFVSPAAPAPATGPLVFGGNGRFVNAATFNVGDRANFQSTGCCGASADFVNLGKLAMPKSLVPSTGLVTLDSLVFENRGTVELASGTLRLGRLGGYNQLSGSTRLTGGRVESLGQLVKLMGGSLRGTGTITANVQNLASTIAPGAPDTAGATGIIKIAGNYTHSGANSVLKIDLKGTTPGGQFDQLQVTGQALLDWGTLDLDTASGFTPGNTTKLKVMTAGQRTGAFDSLKDPQLPNERKWYAIYNTGDVTLGVRRA